MRVRALPLAGRAVNAYRVADTRTQLLDAAAEEFARHGLPGARVQAIVQRAGVNERMIYHHFGSKEALYAAVLQTHLADLAAAWRPAIERAASMPPYEGMRLALAAMVTELWRRPLTVGLWLHEAMAGWRALPAPAADALPAPLRELYERGQEEGRFRADCSFEIAYVTALGAVMSLVIGAPRLAGVVTGEALRDQVVDQLLDGMTGPATLH
jgi:AcrR family transcriptional regulator